MKLQVNLISRIRSESGNWNYYNDEICDYEVKEIRDNASEVIFYIGSYDKSNNYTEVKLKFVAGGIHLENPKEPNIEIKN